MGDRAATETLGMVLVFSMIVITIGLAYSTGLTGLQEYRESQQTKNAMRAFDVLENNLQEIVIGKAPSRATEIKLGDARLSTNSSITVSVNVEDDAFEQSYAVSPIVYESESGGELVYSLGAVIRGKPSGGWVVVIESPLLLNQSRTVIPIPQTRETDSTHKSGGTALVRSIHSSTELAYTNGSVGSAVWVNITSPRAPAWQDHLADKPDVACPVGSENSTACRVTATDVSVYVVKIDVEVL